MKTLKPIASVLVIVGAINWGLVGLGWLVGNADWNVVHMLLGSSMQLEALVYVLVGAAGVWGLLDWKKMM
ncbi:MAG: hypothetical protein G01um101456_237 [Parcubacteria group bacterium Gr01-1014_56]|nr:MAG: hypothetical protein G01um101456_237 [Parcubacteria group bacterium Gr01-1014_56]